ncbi:MAG: hypothetical protein ACOC39_02425 [Desulfovermiculus sp.]
MDMVSQLKAMLQADYQGEDDAEDFTSRLVRLGFKRLVEELLEAEATEYPGRERYERKVGGEMVTATVPRSGT